MLWKPLPVPRVLLRMYAATRATFVASSAASISSKTKNGGAWKLVKHNDSWESALMADGHDQMPRQIFMGNIGALHYCAESEASYGEEDSTLNITVYC